MKAMTPQRHDFTIRPYLSEDCRSVIALFRSSVRTTSLQHYSLEQVTAWAPAEIDTASWHTRCLSRQTWVAELDGKIIGFSDLEDSGHIDMLYVHPAHQGQGVARSLLRMVESIAMERELMLLYTEASITARPVFELSGFCVIAPQNVICRGQTFVNYRMEKKLCSLSHSN